MWLESTQGLNHLPLSTMDRFDYWTLYGLIMVIGGLDPEKKTLLKITFWAGALIQGVAIVGKYFPGLISQLPQFLIFAPLQQ